MNLESTALALVAPGKGILAADESLPTIGKRFSAIGAPNTEENRRTYRELLFTTAGLEEHISGAILFDETIRQRVSGGVPMPDFLAQRGIIPGIKVDQGTKALVAFADEKITEGLDGLRQRLEEYRAFGARFTKWRAVFVIGKHTPTSTAIRANARSLALFAALSQEAGLVPLVEPEVLMDGSHTLARCEATTNVVLETVFQTLFEHRVVLEQMLLKTGMVVAGSQCVSLPTATDVATATLRCLRRSVPAAVPGIVFLSGGQGDEATTERLNAICQKTGAPWSLSFSFGRALQAPAIKAWNGSPQNIPAAQDALRHRAQCNSAAVRGQYSPAIEKAAAA